MSSAPRIFRLRLPSSLPAVKDRIFKGVKEHMIRRQDPTNPYRRVTELFIAGEIVLAIVILLTFFELDTDRNQYTIGLYSAVEAALFFLHWNFQRGNEEIVLKVALWMSTVMLSVASWTGEGIRDGAIAGYSILLVFAGILGKRKNLSLIHI